MKVISFSEIRFATRILDGVKTRTSRIPCKCKHHFGGKHFKVNEKVKLMYKCRSIHNNWCTKCGLGGTEPGPFPNDGCAGCGAGLEFELPKHFASAKITNVDSFIIADSPGSFPPVIKHILSDHSWPHSRIRSFAREEGFDSVDEMFSWFGKAYDLFKGQAFFTYEFELV